MQSHIESIIKTTVEGPSDSDQLLAALFGISLTSRGKKFLELGVRDGVSTLPLLTAAKILDGHLTSVDILDHKFHCPDDLKGTWTFVKSDAIEFLQNNTCSYDVIFIDDWHDGIHVRKEIDLLEPFCNKNTVILLHDLMARSHPDYQINGDSSAEFGNGGPYAAVHGLDSSVWEFYYSSVLQWTDHFEEAWMKYLILGSAGQIGSHLKKFLLKQNHTVDEMDIVISDDHDIRPYPNQVLQKKIDQCDFVYFLAFDVGGARYLKKYQDTYEFISNNVKIMNTVFSYLKDRGKPFLFASSQMSSMDYSSYGTLKRLGERYTKSINGLVTRFWNVYGIEHDDDKSHVVTDFIKKAINTGVIDMMTDGQEERQLLYADDCCDCLYRLSLAYDSLDRSEEFHVSSFEWITILDVARIVQSHIPCVVIPSTETDGVQRNARNDPNKNILKYWKPNTSISDGIKSMCDYYSENSEHK